MLRARKGSRWRTVLSLQPRQCAPRGQLTGQVQAWYQDLLEDRLNALRSFAGRRVSLERLIGRILSLRSSGRREAWTGGSKLMKTLLLVLSMVAGARDATAQEDAQCV